MKENGSFSSPFSPLGRSPEKNNRFFFTLSEASSDGNFTATAIGAAVAAELGRHVVGA